MWSLVKFNKNIRNGRMSKSSKGLVV
jgi:hypothetical protein